MFLDALGCEAGHQALRFQALGGVYIAGGATAKLLPFFTDGRLRRAVLHVRRPAGRGGRAPRPLPRAGLPERVRAQLDGGH